MSESIKSGKTKVLSLVLSAALLMLPPVTYAADADSETAGYAGDTASVDSGAETQSGTADGSDIDGHWAADTILKWSALGWLSADGSGNYRPDEDITRAGFITLINRMKGYNSQSAEITGYTDVEPGKWYYNEISAALAAGYISGTDDKMFPEDPITRQAAMTIIARVMGTENTDISILQSASDGADVALWARAAAAACMRSGLIGGASGKLNPNGNITTAEAAVTLDRLESGDRVYGFAGTYGPASGTLDTGSVSITAPGVSIQNMTVYGHLSISESAAGADLHLDGISVNGDADIYSAGDHAIYLTNVTVGGTVTVHQTAAEKQVRLIVTGQSEVSMVVEPPPPPPPEPEPVPKSGLSSEPVVFPEIYTPSDADLNTGAIIVVGTRAMELAYKSSGVLTNYANTVNRYAAAMPGARVISLVAPVASAFYAPEKYRTGSYDQKALIEEMYAQLDESVTHVDAYTALRAHADEYLYFRTDHHWSQLGAYYAYTAFCDALEYEAVPLEEYETGEIPGFVGSMSGFLANYSAVSVIRQNPDSLQWWRSPRAVTGRVYQNSYMNEGSAWNIEVVASSTGSSNKYMVFISGDNPLTHIKSDIGNGKKIIVLKESYGNAFVPFLVDHYEEVFVLDPRKFNVSGQQSFDLAAFVAAHEIDDVMLINYPLAMSNTGVLNAMIK